MAFLERFSEEELELIVSLPYRAGLWVSQIDDAGGAKADENERAALEKIITEKARGMFESAFVHEVMAEIHTRKKNWDVWGDSLDTLLDDCKKVVKIISGKLDEKDLDAYRVNIMSIGLSVAKAFREFGVGVSLPVRIFTKMNLFLDAFMRFLKRDKSYDTESALNISFKEDVALLKLSEALHEGIA